jgi:nucleotide-binding universal stress UspA family protein
MYDTVLIPIDGSEHAVRAAEHGLHVARQFDATVHVVNVVDLQSAGGLFDAGGVAEEFVDRLEDEGRETVREIEELAEGSDDVRTAVLSGKPSDAILDYADERDADLVFVGTHGRTGLNRYIAGSVTERIVRMADVPVLTVRATERSAVEDGYERILVPTDGSRCAAVAIDHALAIGDASDATIHALNVVDVGAVATSSDVAPATGTVNRLREQGEKATEEVAERAREAGLDAVTTVTEGFPEKELLGYADENDLDLIAMGTHGRRGVDRVLLGSTTANTIRRAEMPVLSVRHSEDGAK